MQRLPGSCKSLHAMNIKLQLDKQDEKSAYTSNIEPGSETKRVGKVIKDQSLVGYTTSAHHWIRDRNWMRQGNPNLFKELDAKEAAEH